MSNARAVIAALVAATIVAGLGSHSATHAGDWRTLATGVEYRNLTLKADERRVTAHALRVDLKRAALRVLDAQTLLGRRRATVDEYATSTRALAVINGGFFDKQGQPLGLVVAEGEVKSKWLKREWGILLVRVTDASIVHARDYAPNTAITQALEVGPRLVVRGQVLKFKDQSARRSAIGLQRDGRVVILATEGALSLKQLAELFAASESDSGLGCVEALHLDSGSSTQLSVRGQSPAMFVRSTSPVPNALGIFPR